MDPVIYAPVFIPTLNRFTHLKRCVQSLSDCTYADKTDLYIALDYPSNDSHWDGYKKIENYVDKIVGFSNVIIMKREKNYGAVRNFFESLSELFEKHDRIIFTEDDNVFAPSFLKFVNEGLIVYENRRDIFSISGYNNPYSMPDWYKNDVYLRIYGFTAWGVGIWRHKWNQVEWSLDSYNKMLNKKENIKIIKRNFKRHLPGLIKIRDTGVILGDTFLLVYLIDKNMSSIYPVKTRVRNTGHDGSGLHGGYSKLYFNQKTYDGIEDIYFPPDIKLDKKLTDLILKKYIKLPFIYRFGRLLPSPFLELLKKIVKKSLISK